MEKRIVITEDGSPSVAIDKWDEQYHSRHGARQESEHVFIKNGLKYTHNAFDQKPIEILEVGFGTGLNALLTAQYASEHKLPVNYTALEAYPLELSILDQLNYGEDDEAQELYEKIYKTIWSKECIISPYMKLTKHEDRFENWNEQRTFDVCYYDAFAPRVQPELWTLQMFEHLAPFINKGGAVVTYCAKGQVRRDLESVGFNVERLSGPPGKREMLRAIKSNK